MSPPSSWDNNGSYSNATTAALVEAQSKQSLAGISAHTADQRSQNNSSSHLAAVISSSGSNNRKNISSTTTKGGGGAANDGNMTLTTLQQQQQQQQPQVSPPPLPPPQVIGSTIQPSGQCPCCRQSLLSSTTQKHKINGESPLPPARFLLQTNSVRTSSSSSLLDQDDDDEDYDSDDDELAGLQLADKDSMMMMMITMTDKDENHHHRHPRRSLLAPGILGAGATYTPTQILVEGWLHKKGTGHDWLGSRAWKARWGRLCMAKLANQDIEVPLLLMYWYPSSQTASTAIVLDQTVVVAVDHTDPKAWNAHRFEIRHAYGNDDDKAHRQQQHVTRTFCAAKRQERDAWVYAMAQALLNHAKSQAIHKRAVNSSSSSSSGTNGSMRATTRTAAANTKWTPKNISMACRATSPPPPIRPLSPPPPSLPKSPRSVRPTVTAPHSYDF